jgi:hypothetical protein
MEAFKLQTLADLLVHPDERVELIGGEIVSPGHELKDTRHLPLLLKRHRVPHDWLIWPETRTLRAHALQDGEWQTILTLQSSGQATDRTGARIPPFDAIELDLADLLGIDG